MSKRVNLISVIVPVYKAEKYLDECILSIVNQTYRNLEIILVDDGSPDRCPEMCDMWAEKDSRIKVIHKENGGASSARNAGLDIAQGDYIGFVDSDDCIHKEMYDILLCALTKSDKKISSCMIMKNRQTLEKIYSKDSLQIKELNVEEAIRAIFMGELGTSFWRRLFARSVFEYIRFPEGEINEEFPLLVPMTQVGNGTVWVKASLYYYRPTEGSVTSNYWKTNGDIILKNLGRIYRQLEESQLNCMEQFEIFAMRTIANVAMDLDLYQNQINIQATENLKKHLKIMRQRLGWSIFGTVFSNKEKILYIMTILRIRYPIYKLIGKC